MIFVYGTIVVMRLSFPGMIDWVEVTVSSVSYLSTQGHQIFVDRNDPNIYSLLYGPLCYLPYALALKLFGATINSLRLVFFLLNSALFFTLWSIFRRQLNKLETAIAIGYIAAALIMNGREIFMFRGDVLLVLAVSLGLVASMIGRPALSIAVFSISCACALNLKLTAAFYFLVPFYLLWRRRGPLTALAAAAVTPLFILLPFAISTVSLRNYIYWLHVASSHPLGRAAFEMNMIGVATLLFPLLLIFGLISITNWPRAIEYVKSYKLMGFVFALSIGGSALTGSLLGGGSHHLNPTFVISTYLAAEMWKELRSEQKKTAVFRYAFAAYALFMIVPAIPEFHLMWRSCIQQHPFAVAVNADIGEIMRNHQGQTIEMGYSENEMGSLPDDRSNFSPELIFKNNPLTVNAVAVSDIELTGLKIPSSTVDRVRSCSTKIWLIPRDGNPFSTLNAYAAEVPERFPDPHLFSASFRKAFFSTYRKTETSRYYDLWTC